MTENNNYDSQDRPRICSCGKTTFLSISQDMFCVCDSKSCSMVKLQVTLGYEITTKHSMVVTCFYMFMSPQRVLPPEFRHGLVREI